MFQRYAQGVFTAVKTYPKCFYWTEFPQTHHRFHVKTAVGNQKAMHHEAGQLAFNF